MVIVGQNLFLHLLSCYYKSSFRQSTLFDLAPGLSDCLGEDSDGEDFENDGNSISSDGEDIQDTDDGEDNITNTDKKAPVEVALPSRPTRRSKSKALSTISSQFSNENIENSQVHKTAKLTVKGNSNKTKKGDIISL